MTNALYKDVLTKYTPGSVGIVAVAGTPGSPAYTSWDPLTVCKFNASYLNGTWQWIQTVDYAGNPDGWDRVFVPDPNHTFSVINYGYFCATEYVPVFHEAIQPLAPIAGTPPTPEQTAYDFNLGWNAGARSLAFFGANGYAHFDAPIALVGAVVGLNDLDLNAAFPEINFGFYFSGKTARIYEDGVQVAYLGPYADYDTFRMERVDNVITYYKNGTLAYTSTGYSAGPVFMDTSLYCGNDFIDNPAIGDLFVGHLSLQPLSVAGGDVAFAQGTLSLRPLTLTSHPFEGGALVLQGLTAIGADHAFGDGRLVMAPLALVGSNNLPVPVYALGSIIMAPLTAAGHGLTGEIGGGTNLALPALTALGSDHVYGEGRLVLQPPQALGYAYEGNSNASMGEFVGTTDAMGAGYQLVAVMSETGQITDVLAVLLTIDVDPDPGFIPGTTTPAPVPAGIGASMGISDTMTVEQIMNVIIAESATIDAYTPVFGSSVSAPATVSGPVTGTGTGTGTVTVTGTVTGTGTTTGSGTLTGTLTLTTGTVTGAITGTVTGTVGAGGVFTGTFTGTDSNGNTITGTVVGTITNSTLVPPTSSTGASVWVLNWDSKATSRYENFAFNSFAQFGTSYYGCKDDGIYLLDGDDDQGSAIRSSASFGKLDFGTKMRKRVPNVYAGMSSTGKMFLKVVDEGTEYVYEARRADATMRAQRFDIGKGIKANFLTFELFNQDGCDFELDSVEFSVVEMTRKI